jgi:hypothetical protein
MSKLCIMCGIVIVDKPSALVKRKTCSRRCLGQLYRGKLRGDNNPNWRGGSVVKNCAECGRECFMIPAKANVFKYCSRDCKHLAESQRKGPVNPQWMGGTKESKKRYRSKQPPRLRKRRTPERLCKKCGLPGMERHQLYHHDCRYKNPALVIKCSNCGVERTTRIRDGCLQRKCFSCSVTSRNGPANPNWKGGITPESRRLRQSDAYKAWRTAVFQRDNFTCVCCGQYGGNLHAHHIKPWSTHPRLRFEVANGQTLCVSCHKETDTFLAKGRRKIHRLLA